MTGLDAILEEIGKEADAQAKGLLDAAKAEAEAALEEARQEAQRQAQEILERAKAKAASVEERAQSTAQLERRDRLLRCKQQLIREALEAACEDLENAPAEEYFSILLELAQRSAQPGEGTLHLRAQDLARLPENFQQELDRVTPQGSITVSPTPQDIPGGFVLTYGPIEMDCTFQALFQAAHEGLRDAAGAILFPTA